jgi:hypothetical protein
MDFTLKTYRLLLSTLQQCGYKFVTVENYNPQLHNSKTIILRHDVDRLPLNSYKTALIEKELEIKGTYYFRIVKQSFDKKIIASIVNLGHEIGYHYEDLALAKGDFDKAEKLFKKHLAMFEGLYDVTTIVMHGSPASRYDNRLMWKKFNYHRYGLNKEPYFDMDFSQILYLTDTGRIWNGKKGNVRDKELTSHKKLLSASYNFISTYDIINAAKKGGLPEVIMLNFHPQRWTDNYFNWIKELVMQAIKNPVKKILSNRAAAAANE